MKTFGVRRDPLPNIERFGTDEGGDETTDTADLGSLLTGGQLRRLTPTERTKDSRTLGCLGGP